MKTTIQLLALKVITHSKIYGRIAAQQIYKGATKKKYYLREKYPSFSHRYDTERNGLPE